MNLQLPEENALTLVGFLGSCFLMHPHTSFDIQCIQQPCSPGRSNCQLLRESKSSRPAHALNFYLKKRKKNKKQVRGGKKGKKIRKERNIERKLARQTLHLNRKLGNA